VREALAEMVLSAESQAGYAPKQQLHPSQKRHSFAEYAVCSDEEWTDPALKTALEMEPEVYAEDDLGCEHKVEPRRIFAMRRNGKLPPFMGVSEKVSYDSKASPQDLNWDMPSTPDHLLIS
jgi:hypothetical protein